MDDTIVQLDYDCLINQLITYSIFTNFRLKRTEPSAGGIYFLDEREEWWASEKDGENITQTKRESKQRQRSNNLLTLNISSRRLYKLQAKIITVGATYINSCRIIDLHDMQTGVPVAYL